MKKQQRLALLLGVLIAVSALTFAVMKREEHKEIIKNTPATVLEMKDIDSVSWDYDGSGYAFRKEDGSWVYEADEAFPVDEGKMADLLEQFASMGAAFTIEEVEDYGQYGLTDPVCTITLTQGDQITEIRLGDYSQMDSQRYASLGDGNVYLLSHDPLEEFDTDLSGLIRQDKTIPDSVTVESISVSGGDSYSRDENGVSLDDDDVYFRDSDGAALDTDRVDAYIRKLQILELTDYVTYNATEQELKDCYLDTPAKTITVTYTPDEEDAQAQTFTLHLGKEPDKSEDEPGQAYARVGDSPILYRMDSDTYDKLMACDYNDLRHQRVFYADFAQADGLTVTLDGVTTEFTYGVPEDSEDQNAVWMLNGEEVDLSEVQVALESMTADEFTSAAPTGRQELSLTVHLNREGADTVTIALYRLDGAQCLAQVDGQSLCYFPRTQAVALIEALNEILLG